MKNLPKVFRDALEKFEASEAKHGQIDATVGQPLFVREAEHERPDAINYLAMFIV